MEHDKDREPVTGTEPDTENLEQEADDSPSEVEESSEDSFPASDPPAF